MTKEKYNEATIAYYETHNSSSLKHSYYHNRSLRYNPSETVKRIGRANNLAILEILKRRRILCSKCKGKIEYKDFPTQSGTPRGGVCRRCNLPLLPIKADAYIVNPCRVEVDEIVNYFPYRQANCAPYAITTINYVWGDEVCEFNKKLCEAINRTPDNHTVFHVKHYSNEYYVGFSDWKMYISIKCDVGSR